MTLHAARSASIGWSCIGATSARDRRTTKCLPEQRWDRRGHPVEGEKRSQRAPYVAVIGDGDPRGPDAHRILEWAEEVGQLLARSGAVVITGGLGGVMRAASRGAVSVDGLTIGILPGTDASEANEFVRVPIATGLGVMRNLVVVTAADAVIAVGGRHGTLSEIGLALRQGRHVVTLSSWRLESDQRMGGPSVHRARDPREAVTLVLRLAHEDAGTER